jgi:predicted nucleotidyltransferase
MGEVDTNIQGLEQLVTRIVERFQPRKVILFGSYASGSAGPESDLDLLVVTAHPPARQRGYEVRAELQQNFPIELQLVFMDAEEFEETQDVVGGLAYPATHQGKLLYEETP